MELGRSDCGELCEQPKCVVVASQKYKQVQRGLNTFASQCIIQIKSLRKTQFYGFKSKTIQLFVIVKLLDMVSLSIQTHWLCRINNEYLSYQCVVTCCCRLLLVIRKTLVLPSSEHCCCCRFRPDSGSYLNIKIKKTKKTLIL